MSISVVLALRRDPYVVLPASQSWLQISPKTEHRETVPEVMLHVVKSVGEWVLGRLKN